MITPWQNNPALQTVVDFDDLLTIRSDTAITIVVGSRYEQFHFHCKVFIYYIVLNSLSFFPQGNANLSVISGFFKFARTIPISFVISVWRDLENQAHFVFHLTPKLTQL